MKVQIHVEPNGDGDTVRISVLDKDVWIVICESILPEEIESFDLTGKLRDILSGGRSVE